MADLIKKIKIKKQDGTFTDYIPIGAEAQNISTSDGDSVQLKLNKKPYYYNSVADMKADTKLKIGDMAVTLGYYNANDGGEAEYIIKTTSGKYYEELNNQLVAELKKENSINVKQLGAKGDGENDDTDPIDKALRNFSNVFIPNGTYIVKKQLRIFNSVIIGETEENTKIIFKEFENEYSIMNNNFWNYPNKYCVRIENLTLIDDKRLTSVASKTIGLGNTEDSIIKNVTFINNYDSMSGGIDLYTNNKNVILDNLKCIATSTTYSNNFIRVREYSPINQETPDRFTQNITMTNLYAEMSGIDECIWIDAWKGKVKNVYGNNIKIISTSSDRANMLYTGVNASNCTLDNVLIENSYFYLNTLTSRLLSIGMSQATVSNSSVNNIKFNNCIFEINETSSTSSSIIRGYQYLIDNGASIENCKLINKGTKIGNAILCSDFNKIISKNNYIDGIIDLALVRVNSYYDKFNITGSISKNTTYIKGAIGSCDRIINNYQNAQSLYTIEDCNLSVSIGIGDSGNTVQTTYNILNSNFDINGSLLLITTPTYEPIINILNTNISKIPLSTVSKGIVNISGFTIGGVPLGSIPSNEHDRYLYNVGTRFISNTPTKSIVRKISAGDQTSDWEEI